MSGNGWVVKVFNPNDGEEVRQFVELYIQMWAPEPFNEFKQCPNCKQYFGEEIVTFLCLNCCPVCGTVLEDAWDPMEVEQDIRDLVTTKPWSVTLVAVTGDNVIGFSATHRISREEIVERWGVGVAEMLTCSGSQFCSVVYFNELGVDKDWRKKGIGGTLAKECLRRYDSSSLVFLRTHSKSPALNLYLKLGLEIIGDDTEYGQGRVLLARKLSEMNLS